MPRASPTSPGHWPCSAGAALDHYCQRSGPEHPGCRTICKHVIILGRFKQARSAFEYVHPGAVTEAGAVVKQHTAAVHLVPEARTLAFSILSLTWALSFTSELDFELECTMLQAVCQMARVLDAGIHKMCETKPLVPLAVDAHLLMPRVTIDSPGLLVVLKPPGWEVDTTSDQTEARCLSTHLQESRRMEEICEEMPG